MPAGYGESLWTPGPWLVSVSARLDRFRNADAASYLLADRREGFAALDRADEWWTRVRVCRCGCYRISR